MSETVLRFMDIFFVVFHTGFTAFVFAGWIIRKFRTAHRIAVLLTAFSWFGLGLFTTIGYCPLTDWHWRVLRALGKQNLPRSYIQYLVERLLGIDVAPVTVDWAVGIIFAIAAAMALVLPLVERRKHRDASLKTQP